MKPLLQAMKERRLYLDGGMGSMLQAAGLPEGLLPDVWGMENPQAVQGVHRAYLEAGCRLITTNTFGTSAPKLAPYGVTPAQVMTAAVANVRAAMDQAGVTDGYVCADIGPSGKLLRPYGDLDFEAAVGLFAETVRAAAQAGADCILIETMSDLYEMKAAVLAAKENCDLPILASLIFDETGKLLTGGSPRAAVALLEGLGVDVFGLNCGLGPKEMAPVFQALWEDTSTPLLLQPNAGLPRSEGGKAVYDVSPADYARQMRPLAPMATLLGGCCGTTPDHLRALIQATQDIPLPEIPQWDTLRISSYCQAQAHTLGLRQSVCKGLKEGAAAQAKVLAESGQAVLDIINGELVPALDEVGKGFEKGTLFLPQLLMSAEAAKAAFQVLKEYLPAGENSGAPQILLATVKGDIHDIGKNIVKVLLESYRFRVLDLGKDVAPEAIVEAARTKKIPLVGLSALMTTTAPAMAETIRQLRAADLPCKVVVGGAVITQDYADTIGADCYAADAMESVHYAQQILGT